MGTWLQQFVHLLSRIRQTLSDWHGGVAAPLYWHGGWALSCWYEVLILLTLMGSPANRAVGMDTMPWPHEARC